MSAEYVQAFRKKVTKTVQLVRLMKSKARNFEKNLWSITKLTLDLQVMVIDLHAKNQLNICKHLEKKSPESQ